MRRTKRIAACLLALAATAPIAPAATAQGGEPAPGSDAAGLVAENLYRQLLAADRLTSPLLADEPWQEPDAAAGGWSYSLRGGEALAGSSALVPSLRYDFSDRIRASVSYGFSADGAPDDVDPDVRTRALAFNTYYLFMGGRAFVNAGVQIDDEHGEGGNLDVLGRSYGFRLGLPIDALPLAPRLLASYRFSDRSYAAATPGLELDREDQRHSLKVGLAAEINRWLDANATFEHINSRSNLSSGEFDESIFTFSLRSRF